MTELVRTEQLTRRYVMGESVVTALEDVTLTIDEGQCASIMGPSGSGKSTLLHLLGGLDRPTSGQILFRGRRLAELSGDELAEYRRTGVGFVFQSFNLVPTLTAAGNVELPMTLAGVSKGERQKRAAELLERVGLTGRAGHRPSQLSGGEQQRVAVARALVNDPPMILADEPTGNLDSKTSKEILDLIRGLEGKAIIIVTHDLELARNFASRTIRMLDGKVEADERS